MTVKCRMDGLAVLKGGSGKATVYFDTKDALKAALDLNEQEIVIGLPETTDLPGIPKSADEIEHAIFQRTGEIASLVGELSELAKQVKINGPVVGLLSTYGSGQEHDDTVNVGSNPARASHNVKIQEEERLPI